MHFMQNTTSPSKCSATHDKKQKGGGKRREKTTLTSHFIWLRPENNHTKNIYYFKRAAPTRSLTLPRRRWVPGSPGLSCGSTRREGGEGEGSSRHPSSDLKARFSGGLRRGRRSQAAAGQGQLPRTREPLSSQASPLSRPRPRQRQASAAGFRPPPAAAGPGQRGPRGAGPAVAVAASPLPPPQAAVPKLPNKGLGCESRPPPRPRSAPPARRGPAAPRGQVPATFRGAAAGTAAPARPPGERRRRRGPGLEPGRARRPGAYLVR